MKKKRGKLEKNEARQLDKKSKGEIFNSRKWNNSASGIICRLKFCGDIGENVKTVRAISETLSRLPADVRKKTIDEAGFITMECTKGRMFWIKDLAKYMEKLKLKALIFLNPIPGQDESEEIYTIAHEIAHFILGHGRFNKDVKPRENTEKEADDLAKKWGFKHEGQTYTEELEEERWLEKGT